MDEYKRRRRRSRAVMSMFLDSLGGSIDNVDVATFDSDGNDLKALIVGIEPVQSGTGNPSPDNIRPITGHSSVNVIVSPTLNPLDGTITNIPLGQTVYGGQLDVLTGVLTVTQVGYVFTGGASENWLRSGVYNGSFYINTGVEHDFVHQVSMCSHAEPIYTFPAGYQYGQFGLDGVNRRNINVWVQAADTSVDDFKTWLAAQNANGTPLTFCLTLATPQTIQLTGQQIATFLGTNNVWCSSGQIIHLEY